MVKVEGVNFLGSEVRGLADVRKKVGRMGRSEGVGVENRRHIDVR